MPSNVADVLTSWTPRISSKVPESSLTRRPVPEDLTVVCSKHGRIIWAPSVLFLFLGGVGKMGPCFVYGDCEDSVLGVHGKGPCFG